MDADAGLAASRRSAPSARRAVISPLLANIYLDPLDRLMAERGYRMVRYADDFVILCRTREEADAALDLVRYWVADNGLTLHPTKTHVGDCRLPGQGFEFVMRDACFATTATASKTAAAMSARRAWTS